MILIELFIFLSTILPLFHLVNALCTKKRRAAVHDKEKKPMSILVPCFNEEDTIALSLRGLLAMEYAAYEVIYINDGSCDGTMDALSAALDLVPEDALSDISDLRAHKVFRSRTRSLGIRGIYRSRRHKNFFVIDKQNGGKSSALNAGICFAHHDLIVTLDADSVLERTALSRMSGAMSDKDVVAVGGSIHIMQGYDQGYLKGRFEKKRGVLVTMQILEYLKGFYIYKLSLAKQNATAIISGAFGVFTKDILLRAGGFRKTLGEDIDITLNIQQMIHKTHKKLLYLPDALCYTQCPESWRDLTRQRIRWQKGFVNCAGYYRRFLLKTMFTKSLSFHFFIEALLVGICSCTFTVFTYAFVAVLAFGNAQTAVVFGIYYGFGLVFTVLYALSAIFISIKHNRYPKAILKKAVPAILLDILFYRFFNLAMYIGGTVSYFWKRGGRHDWNKVARSKRAFNVGNI